MKTTFFWDVAPCNLVDTDRSEDSYLHILCRVNLKSHLSIRRFTHMLELDRIRKLIFSDNTNSTWIKLN
jgi:hypothetical protein